MFNDSNYTDSSSLRTPTSPPPDSSLNTPLGTPLTAGDIPDTEMSMGSPIDTPSNDITNSFNSCNTSKEFAIQLILNQVSILLI